MTNATITETPEQALSRIQSGMSKNDGLAMLAFSSRGVDLHEIEPRINVLTFRAWKGTDRQVAKGAISVPITVWIPRSKKSADDKKGGVFPKTCRLFHVSQTIGSDAPKGTKPEAWNNPALVRVGTYE